MKYFHRILYLSEYLIKNHFMKLSTKNHSLLIKTGTYNNFSKQMLYSTPAYCP
jgi:hypothetical protein